MPHAEPTMATAPNQSTSRKKCDVRIRLMFLRRYRKMCAMRNLIRLSMLEKGPTIFIDYEIDWVSSANQLLHVEYITRIGQKKFLTWKYVINLAPRISWANRPFEHHFKAPAPAFPIHLRTICCFSFSHETKMTEMRFICNRFWVHCARRSNSTGCILSCWVNACTQMRVNLLVLAIFGVLPWRAWSSAIYEEEK